MKSIVTLRNRIALFRKEIKETQAKGKIPADYSLGMYNGIIFAEHLISCKKGRPEFFDRTTSVGDLPKPIALNSGNAIKDTQTYQSLMEQVVLQSRNLVLNEKGMLQGKDLVDCIEELKKSITTMDDFVKGEEANG